MVVHPEPLCTDLHQPIRQGPYLFCTGRALCFGREKFAMLLHLSAFHDGTSMTIVRPRFFRTFLALIALVLSGTGCQTVRYAFVPPTTDSGRTCVVQCAAIRETCRGNEINRAATARLACERQQDRAYQECRARSPEISRDGKDKPKACDPRAHACHEYSNTARCERDYRLCYVDCGGQVMEIVED